MKILFVGLNYHTYTASIISEMQLLGAEVTYVDIQPRTVPYKVFRTLSRSQYEHYIQLHHLHAFQNSSSTAYDKVVFLQAHQVSEVNLALLRKVQSSADFVLYNWDSISNHDYRSQGAYFDRVLTFDRKDARENGYGYLPLFCQRSMQGLRRDMADPQTLFMVGNIVKAPRYEAIQLFRAYCVEKNLNFLQHLKISPVVWSQLMLSGLRPREISFRSIQHKTFQGMIASSIGTFDFANHSQSGQTMRMMESLCAGKKIVTNNSHVTAEPFYTPDRIHVFDGFDFSGVEDFLRMPLKDAHTEFSEYHIQSFVRQLLGLDTLLSETFV